MKAALVAQVLASGLTPEEYAEVLEQRAAADPASQEGLEGLEAERAGFYRLNLHRVGRILRTWKPSPELAGLVAGLRGPQTWMVLSEPWCGDSAQCVPCLEILAASRPDITLRYLLRDDHPDVMDRYLTDGKRGIPILAAFDTEGREIFRWGPRPAAAQAVMEEALAQGLEKPARLEKLHLFYGRDRGRSLDRDLVAVLRRIPGAGS